MFEEIKQILEEAFSVDPSLIIPEAEFVNDLKLNSLDIADFVVMCEEKYGTEVDDEDIHSIITIQDLCDYIASKQ